MDEMCSGELGVQGFVVVTEVRVEEQKVTVLSPQPRSARIPTIVSLDFLCTIKSIENMTPRKLLYWDTWQIRIPPRQNNSG